MHSVDLSSTTLVDSSGAEEVCCYLVPKKKYVRNHMPRVHGVWIYEEPIVQTRGFVFNQVQAFASYIISKSHFQMMNTEDHSSFQPVNYVVSD